MKAHVFRANIASDPPMLGETISRLALENGVRLFFFDASHGGLVAGFGPLELELTEESVRTLVACGAQVERWEEGDS